MIETFLTFLTGVGGITIIGGFSAWLGRIFANRILQQDRVRYETQMQTLLQDLRTRCEKDVFVHRLQFEKEFQIYLELWKDTLALGKALAEFRQLKLDSGKTQEKLRQDFAEAYNRLSGSVYDHRPFYAPGVYDMATAVMKKATEVCHLHTMLKQRDVPWKKTEVLLNDINAMINPLCGAIRRRIWSTNTMPNDDACAVTNGFVVGDGIDADSTAGSSGIDE